MRKIMTLGLLFVVLSGGVRAADAVVVVPVPDKPFTAGEKDIIRIAPDDQPGLTFTHRLTGPAKLVTFDVRDLHGGKLPGHVEYAVVPTGKGKVVFELTTANPMSKPKLKVTRYEFDVK